MISSRSKRTISLLSRLPGVGEKTAQRYLLFLLTAEDELAAELGRELLELRQHLRPCQWCGNIAEIAT
ncbi:MAG TPA: recombination protein RecR, partial [Polyangiaceae bacterium]|nr:recombination protein RecR [Polyangiaceae bacterium]